MKLKNKFIVSGLVAFLLAILILTVFFFMTYPEINEDIKNSELSLEIVTSVFELNILTNDYLFHKEGRSLEQWKVKQKYLTKIIGGESFKDDEDLFILNNVSSFFISSLITLLGSFVTSMLLVFMTKNM